MDAHAAAAAYDAAWEQRLEEVRAFAAAHGHVLVANDNAQLRAWMMRARLARAPAESVAQPDALGLQ
jgi:predicted nucleic acid-binding protein